LVKLSYFQYCSTSIAAAASYYPVKQFNTWQHVYIAINRRAISSYLPEFSSICNTRRYRSLSKYEYCRYRKIMGNTGNTSIADAGRFCKKMVIQFNTWQHVYIAINRRAISSIVIKVLRGYTIQKNAHKRFIELKSAFKWMCTSK
jgi:hypothetical protein